MVGELVMKHVCDIMHAYACVCARIVIRARQCCDMPPFWSPRSKQRDFYSLLTSVSGFYLPVELTLGSWKDICYWLKSCKSQRIHPIPKVFHCLIALYMLCTMRLNFQSEIIQFQFQTICFKKPGAVRKLLASNLHRSPQKLPVQISSIAFHVQVVSWFPFENSAGDRGFEAVFWTGMRNSALISMGSQCSLKIWIFLCIYSPFSFKMVSSPMVFFFQWTPPTYTCFWRSFSQLLDFCKIIGK